MSSVHRTQFSDMSPAVQKTAGLVAGTRVMTADGELPVEYLSPGDRIATRAGTRILEAVAIRVDRDVQMVRIKASSLGFDRPSEETLLPLHQLILIRDWRAQALYGAPQALVAAGRLADGDYMSIETVAIARVFTLQFADDVVIYADGLEIACMRETVTA
ncbi:MAG: Hint domain-containing protein [Rhodoferax sp.]|nr:Hint domain-containing protein [Pseudorhodobacter sp.]